MKIFFVLSMLYLMVTFLFYKKTDKVQSLVSWIIYSVCLLFCYNTVIVYFASLIGIGGSLLNYSIINIIIGSIMLLDIIRKKRFQKYKFRASELILILIIMVFSFLIGYFRFDRFTSITYKSGDPSVHYRHAVYFSERLELLNEVNSKDLVYINFDGALPASYINCGFLMNLISNVRDYRVFLFYDTICLVLYAALFLVTLYQLIDYKKENFLYMLMLTILYVLAFPLNNLIFGFCYLGLGIMNINLLLLFINWFKENFNKNVCFKIINLFFLSLSLFLTYYLYVPCIYLACGIFYICLFKKKKINFKQLLLYGSITLVIPFIIGLLRSILPSFFDTAKLNIFTYTSLDGDRYTNYTPFVLYVYFVGYYLYNFFKKKKKLDFWSLNIFILSGYILIFIILWIVKFSELYYMYKLFYLYWLFVILTCGVNLINKKKVIYIVFSLVNIGMSIILMNPSTKLSDFLGKINMYNWNAVAFAKNELIYTRNEAEILYTAKEHKDICAVDDRIILINDSIRNMWFYSITDMIPGRQKGVGKPILFQPNISLDFWQGSSEFPCAVYFYRFNKKIKDHDYEVLYENATGAIFMKK